jgi:hypothetical protein
LDGYCVVADRDGYASGIVKSEGGKRWQKINSQ